MTVCGIYGTFSIDQMRPIGVDLLDRMGHTLLHRGQDGGGTHLAGFDIQAPRFLPYRERRGSDHANSDGRGSSGSAPREMRSYEECPPMRYDQPDWSGYMLPGFEFEYFPPYTRVLDVGCGRGTQLRQLALRKCHPLGIDLDRASVKGCRAHHLPALIASAERMPFQGQALDGVVCKVVIPYTDEARVLSEICRLLRPDGTARFCYHGAAYYLRYLLCGTSRWKSRIYGLRSLVNTLVYALLGRRMPGFVGDTLYQSRSPLHKYYRACRLPLIEKHPSPTFLGFPVFIYHVVEKVAG